MRVVAPYRSRWSSNGTHRHVVALGERSSPVSAHHTDTDFGADNVASNPATARVTDPSARTRSTKGRPSTDPSTG